MQQYPDNQQPPQQYPYPQQQTPPPPQPPKRRVPRWVWIIIGLFVLAAACSGLVQDIQSTASPATTQTTDQSQATSAPADQSTPADQPTQPPVAQYPPKTLDDLQALAQQGDASQVHEFHSESVGLTGACPQPKKLVTVSSKIKGKQLAEDLLAYFFSNGLDSPCGSVVFAYHTQAEANADNGYTAGRILLDTTDSSGNANLDPNATGITYTVMLNTGDWLNGQEYVVNYTK